jgi:ubiquinone/menaquinone biosynthesis C-methylase UbiE
MKILDLGCGKNKHKGAIGFDVKKLPGVDIMGSIDEVLPFRNNKFDIIYCSHIMEHCKKEKFIQLMEEIHRISKPNGLVNIIVPYYTSKDSFTDPTHNIFFTEHTLDYFIENHPLNYYAKARFKIEKVQFYYQSPLWKYNPFRRILRHYFLNIVSSIYFQLRVVKSSIPP